MLVNVSYNNKPLTRQINGLVGVPFSLKERIRMRGVGSPKMIIVEASSDIQKLLDLDNNRNIGNIELRPKGIIIGFRSLLESFALVIPFDKLIINKDTDSVYTFKDGKHHINLSAYASEKKITSFIDKILKTQKEQVRT